MKINFLKIRYVALILLSIFMFFSCSYGLDEFFYRDGVVNSRARSLLSLPSSEVPEVPSDADYDFWLITDVHFGGEHGKKTGERKDQQFIQKIMDLPQSKRPYFIVCLGDVAEHGKPGEYRNYRKFTDQIAEIPNPLGNPIVTYSIVGNHDLYNSGWESYRKYVYPYTSFYVFQTHGISWYFIDSGSGSLGMYENILKNFGPDSYIGRCASVIMGSTETTFYAITLYYGSVNIKKTRHTLPSALCADFTSFILSPKIVKLFFK
mgnify:CR=1 FL=1